MTTEVPSRLSDDAIALAARIYEDTREDLAKADHKASILFAGIGVFSGVVLGAALSDNWSPATLPAVAEVATWLAATLVYIALLFTGMAVYPQTAVETEDRMTYFGHVIAVNGSSNRLCELLNQEVSAHDGGPAAATIEQLLVLSKVVSKKYQRLQWALASLAAGSGFVVLAIVIAAIA